MITNHEQVVTTIVKALEVAWNAADGTCFGLPFAEDADFVTIRGEHARTRQAIAAGHQAIFDTIYRDSVVRLEASQVRDISPRVLLVQVRGFLKAPSGPLAGEHNSLATMVLVESEQEWRIASFHNSIVR